MILISARRRDDFQFRALECHSSAPINDHFLHQDAIKPAWPLLISKVTESSLYGLSSFPRSENRALRLRLLFGAPRSRSRCILTRREFPRCARPTPASPWLLAPVFSTTTSAVLTSLDKTSKPRASLMLSVNARLLRCMFCMLEPWRGPIMVSVPLLRGGSILITSAPKSANCLTHVGPARTRERSRMRK